jgi:NitT/TauT family transport system permease protein
VRRALSTLGPPIAVVAAALAVWQGAVWLVRPPAYLLPGPVAITRAFLGDAARLSDAMLRTGLAAAAGFGVAALAGVTLGSVLAASRFLQRGVYPLASLLQMVPLVALAPILVIWFGYGGRAIVASSALVSLFPVLANTLDGLRSVDPGLREMFDVYRASRWARFWKLGLPSATPGIVTGLRVAAGLAVIGAVVGEFVSGFGGERAPLGIVILAALREARTDLVFAAVGLSAAVGFLLFGAVSAGGWLALRRWHPSAS